MTPELPGHGRTAQSVDTGQGPGGAAVAAGEGGFGDTVAGVDLVFGDVGGPAVGADRLVVDDPELGHTRH